MTDFMSLYFGPLSKGSCVYFLFLSMLFFVALVAVLLMELYYIVKNYKTLNRSVVVRGFLLLCNLFLAYFVNRLLHTMCAKSLA
jgi:hypothetical protein